MPLLCAIILKSDQDITEIPINWKLGIDIWKNVNTGANQCETFCLNYGEDKAMCGSPACTYLGKKIHDL
jgi:hypothetical protein